MDSLLCCEVIFWVFFLTYIVYAILYFVKLDLFYGLFRSYLTL